MYNITDILAKYKESPGMCNKSELKKIKSFINSLGGSLHKYVQGMGALPVEGDLDSMHKEVDWLMDNHEGN